MKIAFVDVETTGTDHKQHGIIQIACILTDGQTEYAKTWNCAPFEQDEIDPQALLLRNISEAEIKAYPSPKMIHTDLISFLGQFCDKYNARDKMIFSGYNAKFDQDFLREWFRKCGDNYFGSWFWSPPMDVMSIAIMRIKEKRPLMPNFKLGTVAKELGIEFKESELHDALCDIRLTMAIYKKCQNENSL